MKPLQFHPATLYAFSNTETEYAEAWRGYFRATNENLILREASRLSGIPSSHLKSWSLKKTAARRRKMGWG